MCTYSLWGRMSLDAGDRNGEWYCLKMVVPFDEVEKAIKHYHKTWRYVEARKNTGAHHAFK